VDYDTSRTLVDTTYMVLERVHGTDLADSDPPGPPFWRQLGSEIALLHQVHAAPAGVEPDDGGGDPRPTVDKLATDGYLDPGTANWLLGWFDRLAGRIPPDQPQVLLHGDLAPQNLLARYDRLEALIDWGDAAWGPVGMEFAKLPLEQVAATLPSYRSTAGYRSTEGLEAAALWFHLTWGVGGIPRPPRPGERHWTAPPVSRLLGVPEPWRGLG
jgi:aminoglycoside phosphotransferase (APT) family kinase protein